MIKIVNGDLINAEEFILAHQVNCKGVMGSGVAKSIRSKYPEVFAPYKKHCDLSGADLLGKIQPLIMSDGKIVVNMFAQNEYGWDRQYTNVKAFEVCVEKLSKYARDRHMAVAMPYRIGCGRGGANWKVVYPILSKYFAENDLVLYAI